jgi:hypothetical protein
MKGKKNQKPKHAMVLLGGYEPDRKDKKDNRFSIRFRIVPRIPSAVESVPIAAGHAHMTVVTGDEFRHIELAP